MTNITTIPTTPKPTPRTAAASTAPRFPRPNSKVQVTQNDYYSNTPYTALIEVHASTPAELQSLIDDSADRATAMCEALAKEQAR